MVVPEYHMNKNIITLSKKVVCLTQRLILEKIIATEAQRNTEEDEKFTTSSTQSLLSVFRHFNAIKQFCAYLSLSGNHFCALQCLCGNYHSNFKLSIDEQGLIKPFFILFRRDFDTAKLRQVLGVKLCIPELKAILFKNSMTVP